MALEQDQQHGKGTRVVLSNTACGCNMKTDVTTVLVPKLEPQDISDHEVCQVPNAEEEEMIAECVSAKRNLEQGTSTSSSASTEGNNSAADVHNNVAADIRNNCAADLRDQIKFCRYYRKDNQNQSYFARHMLYHAKGKRYCCKHCSKIFACPTNYSLHKLFHSREKYQNSGPGSSVAQTQTDLHNRSSRLSGNACESPSKLPNNVYESPFKKSNQGGIDYERSRQICETEILRSTTRMRLKNPSGEQVPFKIKLPLSTSSGPTSQDSTQGVQPVSQQGSSASTQQDDNKNDQRLCSSDQLASQDSSTSTSCSNTQTVSTNSDTSSVIQEMSPFDQTAWQQTPSVSPFSVSQNSSIQGCYTPDITSLATNISDNLQSVPSVCVNKVIQGLCGSDQSVALADNISGACNNSVAAPVKEMTSPLVVGQPMQVNGDNLAPSDESQNEQNHMSQSSEPHCSTFDTPLQKSNQGGMHYEDSQGMCETDVLGNPNSDGVQYNGKLPMSFTSCPVSQNNIQGMLGISHPVTQQFISQDSLVTSSGAKTLMSTNCGASNVQEIPPTDQAVWQESQGISSSSVSQNNSIQGSYASNPAIMPQGITSWATNHSGAITLTNGTQSMPSVCVKQEVQGLCDSNASVAIANNISSVTSHNTAASSVSETTVALPVAQFKQDSNNSVAGAVSYVPSGVGQGVQGLYVGGPGSSMVSAPFMSTVCAKQKIKDLLPTNDFLPGQAPFMSTVCAKQKIKDLLPTNDFLPGQVRSVSVPSVCSDQQIICLPANEMFSNTAQTSVQCSRTKSLVRLLPKMPVNEKGNSTPQQVVQQSVQWPVQMSGTGQPWMNVQVVPPAMVNNNNNNNNVRTVMMNSQAAGLTNEECINQDSALTHVYPKTAPANVLQPAGQDRNIINFQPAPFWQQTSPMMPSPQVFNVVPMGMSPATQFVVLNPTFPVNSFGQYLPAPFASVANPSYSLPVMFVQNQIQLQGNNLVMGGNQTWLPGQGSGVIHP